MYIVLIKTWVRHLKNMTYIFLSGEPLAR